MIEQVRKGSGPGQGTSAGYETTDGHCVSPPGKPAKGKDQAEIRTRRLLEGYPLAENRARWADVEMAC